MAKQVINIGSASNDGTGDPARTAFTKTNENFDEVYAGIGVATTEEITSGASPVNCDNTKDITYVTSGGTAGDEHVVLPNFTLDGNGYAPAKNSIIHVVYWQTKTNESDNVFVFTATNGNANLKIRDNAGHNLASVTGGVELGGAGGLATFVWYDEQWFLIRYDNTDNLIVPDRNVPIGGTTGQALVKTGNSDGQTGWGDIATSAQGAKADTAVQPGDAGALSGTAAVTGGHVVSAVSTKDFTATFGAITALTGSIVTVTIAGLLTTDHVTVSCISAPPAGMIIANARVSATDTLELYIVTAVALGITLGSLNFRCLVHR